MGRTIPTMRLAIQDEITKTWGLYRRGLRGEDKTILDRLLIAAQQHADACSLPNSSDPNVLILMSVLLEQEKQIQALTNALNGQERQVLGLSSSDARRG